MIQQTDIKFDKLPYKDLTILFHLFHNERPELVRRITHHVLHSMADNIADATERVKNDGILGLGIGPRLLSRARGMAGLDQSDAK